MRLYVFILTDSLATTLNFVHRAHTHSHTHTHTHTHTHSLTHTHTHTLTHTHTHTRARAYTYMMTESNVARWTSRCQKLPLRGARWKGKKAPSCVHLEGSNRGGSGVEPAALSVLCFVPCFYLHRIIYFPYIPRTNARYKAVRGAADISTQAGSLETFELLARRADEVWGWWRRLSLGWFRAAREKCGVASGVGTETGGAASRG